MRRCCLLSSSTNPLAAPRSNAVHSVSPMAFIISCIGFSITLFVFASPNVCSVSFFIESRVHSIAGELENTRHTQFIQSERTVFGTCGMRSARDATLVYASRQQREMFCICLSQRKILVFHLNAHASCERWIEGNLYIRECRQCLLQRHLNYSFRRSHTRKKRKFSAFTQRVFFYIFIHLLHLHIHPFVHHTHTHINNSHTHAVYISTIFFYSFA